MCLNTLETICIAMFISLQGEGTFKEFRLRAPLDASSENLCGSYVTLRSIDLVIAARILSVDRILRYEMRFNASKCLGLWT